MNRIAQIFTLDLILGLVITTVAVLALSVYTLNHGAPLRDDAERVATLMTEGVPSNWTTANVNVPGFLTDDRFDSTKINAFAALNYTQQRSLLGIRANHTIRFYRGNTTLPLCSTCGSAITSTGNILPIRRYGLWNGTIVTMEVTLFR